MSLVVVNLKNSTGMILREMYDIVQANAAVLSTIIYNCDFYYN